MRDVLSLGTTLALLGAVGYLFFIYEPPELVRMKKYCAEKGTTVERRQNAITTGLFGNYHYACKGYDLFGKKL